MAAGPEAAEGRQTPSRAFASDALADRVVLVTGGCRGIGGAVALAAATAGATVAIGHLHGDQHATGLLGTLRALGGEAEAFQADLGERAQARGLVAAVEDRFGRVDGLVNNAGIMPTTPFLEVSDAEWDLVVETDLSAAFGTCQAALPGMLARGGGTIVNVASRLAQVGMPGVVHYSAAKAGLIALTKSLAREFGQQGIRVNAVAPGVTNTAMGRTVMAGEVGARRRAELPLGRFAEPAEVADAVVFLLTDAAALFLGQTLNPNSGGFMP